MILSAEPFVLGDFGGGLDTKTNPLLIQANKSPHCLNVHTDIKGAVQARNGFDNLNSAGETGDANGLYDFPVNQSDRILVEFRGSSMYKMDGLDGTWDAVTLAAAITNDQVEFDTFDLGTGSNRLIMSNHSGADRIQYWDGSGSTTQVTDTDSGFPRFIKVWQQRVWTAGDNADPNNLKWSDSGSVTAWTATNNTDIVTNDGDFITGLAVLKKNLFIFKRYSIHRVTYTGGDPLIEVSPVVFGTGCIASKTIKVVNIPEVGEALVFLTPDGDIMAFTGHSEGLIDLSIEISGNNGLSPISTAQLNGPKLTEAHSVVLPSKHWYICFVPSMGSVLPDYALVFDYLNRSWWPWDNMNFGASAQVINGNSTLVYAQGTTGTLLTYRLDYGNDDNGTAINRLYTTSRLYRQSTSRIGSSRGAQITLKQVGDYDINFHHRLDYDSAWSTAETINMRSSTSVLGDNLPITLGGADAVVSHIDIPKLKNLIQFKVETDNTDPPWALYRIEEIADALGVQP